MTKREVEEYIMSLIFSNTQHAVTAENVRNAFAPIVERVWVYLEGRIGDLSQLQTTDKQSVVNAINYVLSKLNHDITLTKQEIANIGSLSDLVTEDKSNLVNAINEAYAHGGGGGGGGGSTIVVNNLTSTSTTAALSANQGRLLNENKIEKGGLNVDEFIRQRGYGMLWYRGSVGTLYKMEAQELLTSPYQTNLSTNTDMTFTYKKFDI